LRAMFWRSMRATASFAMSCITWCVGGIATVLY
jgi:hypothetical protein